MKNKIETDLNKLVAQAQETANNHGWIVLWDTANTADPEIMSRVPAQKYRKLSIGDAIALCHSELSEALEEYRNDDKVKFTIEIADEFIHLLHLCGDLKIDIAYALSVKMEANKQRPINHGRANL